MTRYIFLTFAIGITLFARAQNVGIGTTTPAAKLDIIGSIKITDGTQGANKILTSGSDGLATWATPPAPACFFIATDQSVGLSDFIGLGTNSATFTRNSLVVPFNCEIRSITISTRVPVFNQQITATLWRQSQNGPAQATTLSVTIVDGSQFFTASTNGAITFIAGDLFSVRLNWPTGGALASGVTVALSYK